MPMHKLDYFVYTSNLDTMWRRSGFSNNRVIEYHGSLDYLQSSSKNRTFRNETSCHKIERNSHMKSEDKWRWENHKAMLVYGPNT